MAANKKPKRVAHLFTQGTHTHTHTDIEREREKYDYTQYITSAFVLRFAANKCGQEAEKERERERAVAGEAGSLWHCAFG